MEGTHNKGLSVTAKSIIPSGFKLIYFQATTPLSAALAQLIQKDLYSAPVRDGETWLGFLELADIVHYVVKLFAEALSVTPTSASLATVKWTPQLLASIQERFDKTPIKNLINLSGRTPFLAVPEDTPLQEVVNALVHRKLARLALMNSSGQLSAVISPSGVVNYLSKHIKELDATILNKTLDEANVAVRTHVTSCTRQDPTIVAFAKIAENHISHLALEDPATGILAGNLSLKDIKLIQISENQKGVQRLLDPVGDYVNEILRMNLIDPPPALHADVKDTIERTMLRLAIIRIHRLYLTESKEPTAAHKPIGVISLRDVLTAFAK